MLNPIYRTESQIRLKSIRSAAKVTFRHSIEKLTKDEKKKVTSILNELRNYIESQVKPPLQ
ncbi:MAG: hypothetical protein K2Z81_14680 [Cyanobacteria bacterium]|nr:hypothetical protein [Cyanobacteriota bacterium]